MTYPHHLKANKSYLIIIRLVNIDSPPWEWDEYRPYSCSKPLSSLTCHSYSKMRSSSTHWRSKTFTNITIILIDAIYKEFYKCWSCCPARASANSKTLSQTYESLIKLFACVSTPSNANAFLIRCFSERSSWSLEGPWVKRQEDGWLDAVREPIFRMSTSVSFYWSFIGGQSLLIVRNLGGESKLGLDGLASLDYQPDGW